MDIQKNIIPHKHAITKTGRVNRNGFSPKVIWFSGLSGSGKSTLASALESYFFEKNIQTYILDGDNIRKGLNSDLSFSDEDRTENIRRISEVANLFTDAGVVVLTAFISPFESDRDLARRVIGADDFIEVYVKCPLEVCESRDVKGLYKKARAGVIKDFTGINSPFEEPNNPELVVDTANNSLQDCLQKLIENIDLKK